MTATTSGPGNVYTTLMCTQPSIQFLDSRDTVSNESHKSLKRVSCLDPYMGGSQ